MFGCCCANKKALKIKEQQKNADARVVVVEGENDNKKSPLESPKMISTVTDAAIGSPMSPASDMSEGVAMTRHENNDKSNSSDEANNLSGLIISDGLVGESFYRAARN